jgi:ankyrin repeat protein
MKSQLIAIVAAVLVVGCGPSVDIHQAAEEGNIEAVKQHIAAGTDVNAKGQYMGTPLHYAAGEGHKEIAELLIEEGADVNAKADNGKTPLDRANDKETAALLRKHGGKTGDWLNADKSIHKAARAGHIEAVKQHIASGTDVNAKNGDGYTCLHLTLGRHKEVAELLINKGADVNVKLPGGWTPLLWAVINGLKEVAELLIASGADVNWKDKNGGTLLHRAALEGHKEIVKLLIAEGADANAKTKRGETPLDAAITYNPKITDLIRKHGGKTKKELEAAGN